MIDSKKMECVSKMVRLEHKADFLRLSILKQSGGIYLDTDIITVKKFDQLLTDKVVMGKEQRSIDGPVLGLCNAVIIAPKNAAFISHWLECYQNFHNDQWGEFSVETPWRLAQSNPDLINLEPVTSFFWPNGWPEGLIDLFEVKQDYPDAYTLHLWRSAAKDYLGKLTVEKIAHRNTTFTSAVKHLTRDCISEADRKMVQKDNCRNGPMLRSQL